ncbi:hypothetical protein C8P69_102643 [Phreatobacter oligotrophus]|uniref:Uncharacterized protein n=1 Tax=Phreatobacter oligotrophus TaxID=1122261 RepID=A0A2T4ZH85_9HYPH|nr:hypothetical protein C8P69_102643 [Phreatobacter oligotrophus]
MPKPAGSRGIRWVARIKHPGGGPDKASGLTPGNDPHASRRASRRFTAAFVVIRAARPGRAVQEGGASEPWARPCRLPGRPTGEAWAPDGPCRTDKAVARLPAPGEADAPPVLLARLAMLLAQRSPPARQRLRGPKGRCSRRRPRARAGDPRRDGTAPPPHRPHHRTMPRRGRRCGKHAAGLAGGDKFAGRGRAAARKGAGGQGVGRRGRMGGGRSYPLKRLPGCTSRSAPFEARRRTMSTHRRGSHLRMRSVASCVAVSGWAGVMRDTHLIILSPRRCPHRRSRGSAWCQASSISLRASTRGLCNRCERAILFTEARSQKKSSPSAGGGG